MCPGSHWCRSGFFKKSKKYFLSKSLKVFHFDIIQLLTIFNPPLSGFLTAASCTRKDFYTHPPPLKNGTRVLYCASVFSSRSLSLSLSCFSALSLSFVNFLFPSLSRFLALTLCLSLCLASVCSLSLSCALSLSLTFYFFLSLVF